MRDYERAPQDWDEAIRLDSKIADAYEGKGAVYAILGQYELSIQYSDEAIRLDPKRPMPYKNRGVAYKYLGKLQEANRDFAKAKELGVE